MNAPFQILKLNTVESPNNFNLYECLSKKNCVHVLCDYTDLTYNSNASRKENVLCAFKKEPGLISLSST